MIALSYMGTKRLAAPCIADVICQSRSGIVLDAFSGMCAVGSAIGQRRQVWTNDTQLFSAAVARSLFVETDAPPVILTIIGGLFDAFDSNRCALRRRFALRVSAEAEALAAGSLRRVTRYLAEHTRPSIADARNELSALRNHPKQFPYRLFSLIYGDTYFGFTQCIEIDSLVYALDRAVTTRKLSRGAHTHLLVALGCAVKKLATTTGHFAQFLEPRSTNLPKYLSQRTRSVWDTWLEHVALLEPLGSDNWRRRNRVYNCDTLKLLPQLRRAKTPPSIVYADPPYTTDQYSRYYHILDTLIAYDYPRVSGKALYREGRFHTPFSLRSTAVAAFDSLASSTRALGAHLIVSYPENGLLHELGTSPITVLKRHFSRVRILSRVAHTHSTLGASKGSTAATVMEALYLAA